LRDRAARIQGQASMASDIANDRQGGRKIDRETMGAWILAVVMGLVSLAGLAIASRAEDDVFYGTGLGLFAFGVIFIYGLIYRYVGR
jgi:hypothetical protein